MDALRRGFSIALLWSVKNSENIFWGMEENSCEIRRNFKLVWDCSTCLLMTVALHVGGAIWQCPLWKRSEDTWMKHSNCQPFESMVFYSRCWTTFSAHLILAKNAVFCISFDALLLCDWKKKSPNSVVEELITLFELIAYLSEMRK